MIQRVRRDHMPYDVWEKQGCLMTTEGNVIHYGFIENFIDALGKKFLIQEIAFDRWIYRLKFQRDIYNDLRILEKSIGEGDEEHSNLDLFSLEMFENIAYTMAKHADPKIPDDVEEWLDSFNTFSIYQVLPELIKLWGLNVQTDVEAKKNFALQSVK